MVDRYAQCSDDNLISMIRKGNRQAVTELVMRYLPLIRHKAAGYYCLPGMESDDVVQEGLLGLLKAISLYEPEKSSFATFASLCIVSSLATAAKSAYSQKSLPLSNYAPLSDGEVSQSGCGDPEQHLVSAEQAAELLNRIDTMLSPFEQQTLKLYLTGHSYTEISISLSATSKAVDNALQRVRRKLRSAD